ncbi:glycoside hydrolase family 130 protein [Moheibacter sediminis]|uniref:Predicted glycosyl hydrolase, GH43/DUF377 family n=1 Tax=Moheibacter sediminis TaxID=1434700 RepID=A0A1W1ZEV8_9FLAO|nr:glycoside hydrolase family 130 protein [Moheibacter sediminis]SMC46944.1 Predicted glycosyl hydrolase, GH43/DUF377 family [Moheibacter sediminis]
MKVEKSKIRIKPSAKRWLLRPFVPGNPDQVEHILLRILSTDRKHTDDMYRRVFQKYKHFHKDIEEIFLRHFGHVQHRIPTNMQIDDDVKLIIGAYFSQFYALESTALFNPSIVINPNKNLNDKSLNFILSLRAVGEGHISSVVFREGTIDENFEISIKEPQPFIMEPEKTLNRPYEKNRFIRNLNGTGLNNEISELIFKTLSDEFSFEELNSLLEIHQKTSMKISPMIVEDTINNIRNLALSNYDMAFSGDQDISERVIYPMSPSQTNGIEDARFVRFEEDNGDFKYYATFTAYNGRKVVPELLETKDFLHFKVSSLSGPKAKNKGMALFPKKIDGNYMMLGRQDNETIYLMASDDPLYWKEAIPLAKPTYAWEFVQIGNCGSPIELDEGWLVLTHGVGAMRRYCIGAILLDKKNPDKVLGRLKQPLLEPVGEESFGYVPNVLYSCGALVFNGRLILPYAMSDSKTLFAHADIQQILSEMV